MVQPQGMMGALGHDIGPNQLRMVVVIRLKIDDEILHLHGVKRYAARTNLLVLRGQEGTTAAAHTAGAEVEYLPPYVSPEVQAELADMFLPAHGGAGGLGQVRSPYLRRRPPTP